MPGPDLHVHSTASDGSLSPTELVALAEALCIPALSITDHDSVGGVIEALDVARCGPVTVIPGVELSAGVGDRGIHILGYYIDHMSAPLRDRLEQLRVTRLERAERIVYALSQDGFDITLDDVLAIADGGTIGRAHIAQLLVSTGRAPTVTDAFRTLLGSSAPYYVPKPVCAPAEVISWIADAGGVAVLAHPGLSGVDDLIAELVDVGIVGIEAYHGAHDAATRDHYARLADEYGLIVTGGSDFHGEHREGERMGSANVPESVTAQLASAHQRSVAKR
jgi:hypothetical protein